MNYQKILTEINRKKLSIEGIQAYDQGKESIKEHINIQNGVCRALVIEWLKAKKDDSDFWKGKGTVSEPLLQEVNRLKDAVDLQTEYENASGSRFVPDTATKDTLEKSGVTYKQGNVTASAQQGFAVESLGNELKKIADKVLDSDSRFFILSIQGNSGAHSLGIYRPYASIGKSKDAYLFDPNIGEFKSNGKQNLCSLLKMVNSEGYANSGMDLNKSYILWSFSG
ncbi:YopT-type cysteine protease domain-containing protein [Leptothoe sp. LEGE 181152]|nr:YopT-type cysteine protease domain-containing protein [Leptothoe sp. LEGE 181152]